MASLITDKKGQIMLLTALLIIIGVIAYTTILNSMVYNANMPSTGLEVAKKDISEFRKNTELEIFNAALFSKINTTGDGTKTLPQVQDDFMKFMESYIESIKKLYAARGISVEIILNNVTFNETKSTTVAQKYFVERKSHNFSTGSLVIPMDKNQTNQVGTYGFIYKLVDDTGTGPLNNTRVPVWDLLQNAVNGSYPDFYVTLNTDDNATTSGSGNVTNRKYSGAPFLIENSDLNNNETLRQLILAEAKNKGIVVHKLVTPYMYPQSVLLLYPPRIAIYPKGDSNTEEVMEPYYQEGQVPYTDISNTDINNGVLSNYDILTIPHYDFSNFNSSNTKRKVITNIEGWVANGGILHVECLGVDTMDDAVESVVATKNKHTWYGFIGINGSDRDQVPNGLTPPSNDGSTYNRSKDGRFMKLVDNNTPFNLSYTYNMTPLIPLDGLADPGAPYDPVAQADNASGIFGSEIQANGKPFRASTTAFSLRTNPNQVNPDTNILAYSSYANGTPLYGDYSSENNVKVPMLTYIEAPYDKGLVVYIAGHNLTQRGGYTQRLIFESFFAASMKRTETMIVSAKTINVTIRYFDGKVMINDTLIINI
jgi:hypothetical protein